ncbi:uncharacterized protein [Cherax quadricarinatus]|uniref:uncharacterized protein isoform X2 n=1 Tax=Cherax quadricarinatus TaxID=27406 RepID=UPI00387E7E3A
MFGQACGRVRENTRRTCTTLTFLCMIWLASCLTHTPQQNLKDDFSASSSSYRNVLPANISCGMIKDIVLTSAILCDLIDAFKNNYTLYEYGESWDTMDTIFNESRDNTSLQICDEEGTHCMYVLPNLPPESAQQQSTQQHSANQLVIVLDFVQRYTVAMESLLLDQTLHENVFASQMAEIHANLEGLIDSLINSVIMCDLQPYEAIVANLSVRMYKGGDTVIRAERGFRTLRQVRRGLQYIIDIFGTRSLIPKS